MGRRIAPIWFTLLAVGLLAPAMGQAAAGDTVLVKVDPDGNPESTTNFSANVSPDGRHTAFQCGMDDLSGLDNNGGINIFLRDMVSGTISLVNNGAAPPTGDSLAPSASENGRYVLFQSDQDNLSNDDDNASTNVFVRDTGTVALVNIDPIAPPQPVTLSFAASISHDGRYVAFFSDMDDMVTGENQTVFNVFLKDMVTRTVRLVNTDPAGNPDAGGSVGGEISADGRYVAFQSDMWPGSPAAAEPSRSPTPPSAQASPCFASPPGAACREAATSCASATACAAGVSPTSRGRSRCASC